MENRFWEIDFFRGMVIISMVLFHIAFDADYLGIIPGLMDKFSFLAFPIAASFIFIAGVSISISMARRKDYFSHAIKRGFFMLLLGMMITLITFIVVPNQFIIFGILHFLGIAIIISPLLEKANLFNPIAAVVSVFLGIYLISLTGPDFLLPIGIHSVYFQSLDYFPIFPWLGIFIFGSWAGKMLYPNGKRGFIISEPTGRIKYIFSIIGRNSLLIYMMHQPIILSILLAVKTIL